jgi:hypothetical protein
MERKRGRTETRRMRLSYVLPMEMTRRKDRRINSSSSGRSRSSKVGGGSGGG